MMRVNRRTFLNLGITTAIGLFLAVWNKMTLSQIKLDKQQKQTFPFDKNKPVSFIDEFIIINQNNQTQVFRAHCTHLGCKINQVTNGKLLCPCHGSEYDLNGQVLKGPAYKNLHAVHATLSDDCSQIEIES